jgi:AraC family transcriptional regulator, regulatory protein of adaptative response / methylated-DNA-[protein]-cysteine methyltransferase
MADLVASDRLLEHDRAALKSIHDYRRIERAIQFIDGHVADQPSLEEVAREIGLSPFHAQRLFTRWAGISPKRFLGLLTVGHAKAVLQAGESVLDTAYEVGLSGPSRLHDLFVGFEAMTPGEYKQQGASLTIRYGIHPTRFGEALLLTTERGIAGLSFVDGDPEEVLAEARAAWPLSRMVADPAGTGALIRRLFGEPDGAGDDSEAGAPQLLLKGTNFQVKVWSALLRVPPGRVVSYLDLAGAIGQPGATRAVAGALARNPIGYLVPCHRVIRATGALGDYRWGRTRRRALLAWESAQAEAASA